MHSYSITKGRLMVEEGKYTWKYKYGEELLPHPSFVVKKDTWK